MRRLSQILLFLAISLILPVTVLGQANNPNTNEHGWGKNPTNQRTWGKNPNATAPVHQGWGPRANTVPPNSPPPGWGNGRKVGWHGNDMPPGQMRRDPYDRHYRHRHHRDWDRDRRFRHHRDWDRDHDRFRHHRDHDRFRH
jgi:hypothetical protein